MSLSSDRIEERCSCGAYFTTTSSSSEILRLAITQFRTEHIHEMPLKVDDVAQIVSSLTERIIMDEVAKRAPLEVQTPAERPSVTVQEPATTKPDPDDDEAIDPLVDGD